MSFLTLRILFLFPLWVWSNYCTGPPCTEKPSALVFTSKNALFDLFTPYYWQYINTSVHIITEFSALLNNKHTSYHDKHTYIIIYCYLSSHTLHNSDINSPTPKNGGITGHTYPGPPCHARHARLPGGRVAWNLLQGVVTPS